MAQIQDRRRARRLSVEISTLVEKIGHRELHLHPKLAQIYERVHPNGDDLGLKLPGAVLDLSTNGCFIAGQPLPLLSRVAFSFPLEGYGQVEALGWTMWRRASDCEIPVEGEGQRVLSLKSGFGVLFESIPLDARLHIAHMVQQTQDAE